MKASEFKKILKPLIIQSVREVLLQEDVLSSIVVELAKGLGNPVNENKQYDKDLKFKEEELERQRKERIKKLNESNKFGDAFTGTREIHESDTHGPLAGVATTDSGVDIAAIEQLSNGKWKTLMG